LVYAQVIETELKYDDGSGELLLDRWGKEYKLGLKIVFSPPASPWTIKEIKVYGRGYGDFENRGYLVEIWDSDSRVLFSRTFTGGFTNKEEWVSINLSSSKIKVKGDFYVIMFPDSYSRAGFAIGIDTSSKSKSDIIWKHNRKPVYDWYNLRPAPWMGDNRDRINWMVRVVGTSLAPSPDVKSPSLDAESAPAGPSVKVEPQDKSKIEDVKNSKPAVVTPERTFFGVDLNMPVLTDPTYITLLTLVLGVLTLLIQLFRGV